MGRLVEERSVAGETFDEKNRNPHKKNRERCSKNFSEKNETNKVVYEPRRPRTPFFAVLPPRLVCGNKGKD